MKKSIIGAAGAYLVTTSFNSSAAAVSGQGTWETTLQGRDLDGNPLTYEAYYDTVLDVSWLADANYAQTSGYNSDGKMTGAEASTWASSLNINGITGWRLPATNPVNGSVYDISYSYDGSTDRGYNISAPGTIYAGSIGSEMAHLFYNTLGNWGECDPQSSINCSLPDPSWGLSNSGPFSNIHFGTTSNDQFYWSGTLNPNNTNQQFNFGFNSGVQNASLNITTTYSLHAWAVHQGDVGTAVVPIPTAAWLFGSGLIGLIGAARRKVHA